MFDTEALDAHQETIFAIDPEGCLVYINAAWHAFARKNEGQPDIAERWSLGANVYEAIPEVLQSFYSSIFARTPAYGTSPEPVSHDYECSSALVHRRYRMLVYSLPESRGHLVVNSLLVERLHENGQVRPDLQPADYLDEAGMVHQCAHCRRVRHPASAHRWDWVPGWVEGRHGNVSHGLCQMCLDYYFGATWAR